jgi:tetratricopeptide (TPR) repeat protein
MSLLYKSLEQLRRKEGDAKKAGGEKSLFAFMSKPKGKGKGKTLFGITLPDLSSLFHKSPGKAGAKGAAKGLTRSGQSGASGTRKKILLSGVLLLLVLGVSTAAGLYFFSDLLVPDEPTVQRRSTKRTVTRPTPAPEPAVPLKATTASKATENETIESEPTSPVPPTSPIPTTPETAPPPAPAIAKQAPAADHPPEPAPAPTSRKSKGQDPLESHFSKLAKRNQDIMYLENSLAIAMRTGDTAGARDYLDSLMDTAGENSPAVLKWEGFLALKENRPAEAEDWFRRALGRAPNDVESKYNLIVALMLQNKQGEAQAGYREMAGQHPSDPRIQRLGAMLGL